MSTEYELVLMLDPEAPDERREQVATEARGRIEAGGGLRHAESWGMRKMAYEIRRRNEADYRFFRFEGDTPLLDDLDHSLKIADGVLRFRLFEVDPQAPLIEPPPAMGPRREGRREGPGAREEGRRAADDDTSTGAAAGPEEPPAVAEEDTGDEAAAGAEEQPDVAEADTSAEPSAGTGEPAEGPGPPSVAGSDA